MRAGRDRPGVGLGENKAFQVVGFAFFLFPVARYLFQASMRAPRSRPVKRRGAEPRLDSADDNQGSVKGG